MIDAKILGRLLSHDSQLAGDGLHVFTAAKQHGVSDKTIRRDLDLLARFGRHAVCTDRPDYLWRYKPGVRPLFTDNAGGAPGRPRKLTREQAEAAVKAARGNQSEAARRLGVSRRGLIYALDRA
jgi:transcriptional regulator of acetoin/glycerol metabolism